MTTSTDPVELLERALSYTRGALGNVDEHHLDTPTPCARWDLADLLDHMADSLDAFLEASSGVVALVPAQPIGCDLRAPGPRVRRLQDRACQLLGAWSTPTAASVRVGDAAMATRVLLTAGALEIAAHGWDVARATGGPSFPPALAADLLPYVDLLVTDADRGVRFAAAREVPATAAADVRLLALLGRSATSP